jgi:hypothetical protein
MFLPSVGPRKTSDKPVAFRTSDHAPAADYCSPWGIAPPSSRAAGGLHWRESPRAKADAMTEQEWLACTHPITMVEFVRARASERKARLVGPNGW